MIPKLFHAYSFSANLHNIVYRFTSVLQAQQILHNVPIVLLIKLDKNMQLFTDNLIKQKNRNKIRYKRTKNNESFPKSFLQVTVYGLENNKESDKVLQQMNKKKINLLLTGWIYSSKANIRLKTKYKDTGYYLQTQVYGGTIRRDGMGRR